MIEFLNDISCSYADLQAFMADPEGFLDRYEDMTAYERELVLSRDSTAIDWYLKNRVLNGDDTVVPVHAATTVVVIAVLIGVAAAAENDGADDSWRMTRHDNFWSHVAERGAAYAQ